MVIKTIKEIADNNDFMSNIVGGSCECFCTNKHQQPINLGVYKNKTICENKCTYDGNNFLACKLYFSFPVGIYSIKPSRSMEEDEDAY